LTLRKPVCEDRAVVAMSAEQVVRDYFEFANTEQWDRLATVFTEDATYRTPGARPRSGREDVAAFYPKAFSAWAQHQDTPGELIVDGDRVACEITFTGTTHGGTYVTFDCVDIFQLRDGKIATLSTWYDLDPVRKAMLG
jgi:ketosteroid isomerase-like protein